MSGQLISKIQGKLHFTTVLLCYRALYLLEEFQLEH